MGKRKALTRGSLIGEGIGITNPLWPWPFPPKKCQKETFFGFL